MSLTARAEAIMNWRNNIGEGPPDDWRIFGNTIVIATTDGFRDTPRLEVAKLKAFVSEWEDEMKGWFQDERCCQEWKARTGSDRPWS